MPLKDSNFDLKKADDLRNKSLAVVGLCLSLPSSSLACLIDKSSTSGCSTVKGPCTVGDSGKGSYFF